MNGNLGNANIGVNVDLASLGPQLNQMFSEFEKTVGKIKTALGIKIDAPNTTEVSEGLQKVGREAGESGHHIKQLGESGNEAIGKLLRFEVVQQVVQSLKQSFSAVKDYVMDFVNEFAGADLATQKLRGGLERIKSGDYFDTLIKQAGDLSKITPFDDDDISNMQSMLLTFDGISAEAVGKLTPAMLNLASAFAQGGDTGMGLTQVAMLIGKAAGAELYTALQRVGIVMTDTQKKMLETATGMDKINIIMEVMSQNGNITAEAFGKTLAGQLKIADNEIKNVKESLGEALAPAVLFIIGYVKDFAANLQKLPDAAKIAIVAIGAIATAGSGLIAVFTILDITTGGILLALGLFVTELVVVGTYLISRIDDIKNWINENKNLTNGILTLKEKFGEFKDAVVNAWDALTNLFGKAVDFKELVLKLASVELRGLVVALTLVLNILNTAANIVTIATSELKRFKDAIFYAAGELKNIGSAVLTVIDKMLNLKNNVSGVIDIFRSAIPTTLTDSIASVVKFAADKIIGLRNALFDLLGIKHDKDANGSVNDPTAEGGTTATTWTAGQYAPKKKTETADGKGKDGSGSEKDPYKEETDSLKNLMKLQEDELKMIKSKIELEEATPVQLVAQIQEYKKLLTAQLETLEKDTNRADVNTKILELRVQEKHAMLDIDAAIVEATKSGAKMYAETLKKDKEKFALEGKAIQELQEKKINNSDSAYAKDVFNINKKYDAEEERIRNTYADTDVLDQLLAENKRARDIDLHRAELNDATTLLGMYANGFNEVIGAIGREFSSMWDSVFGEANSLFEILMKSVYQQLVNLAASNIFTGIINLLSGGAAGGILGFFGSLFASGGYTGDGPADEAAGVVHKGEYVVSQKGVNPENLPVLEAMNSGERMARILARYNTKKIDPSVYLGNISAPKGNSNTSINVGGISVAVKSSSMGNMSESEWIKLVDNKIIPQISKGLKRIGKPTLDNTITN